MEDKKLFRIYGYQNILHPGRWYVGTTGYKYQSQRAGKNGSMYRKCPKFWEGIQQDGWENFKYNLLDTASSREEAFEKEKEWIRRKNSVEQGYNLEEGGLKGRKIPEYRRLEIAESSKRENLSQLTLQKMSESHKEILLNRIDQSKGVRQFTKDGQFVKEYPSIREASRQTGIDASLIGRCCKNLPHHNTAGDSIWKYAS